MIKVETRNATWMKGDYSAYVSFPYNAYIVQYIKSFSNRAWHPKSKEWEVPLEKVDEIKRKFGDVEVVDDLKALEPKEVVTSVSFDFKTKPFKHQRESFLYGMNNNKWFLGDEMGLGKTKQVIDIATKLKQDRHYEHCLIVCGVNGLKYNWLNEVHVHSNEDALILGTRYKKRTGEMYIGGNKERSEDMDRVLDGDIDAYFLITNVESMRNKEVQGKIKEAIDLNIIQMMAIDECHKCIKGDPKKSQQARGIIELQPEYRIAMTGTPLMNSPLDLYGILKWLGYEHHSFWNFSHYYADYGGYGGYQVVGYKHLDELEKDLDTVMLRRLKDEVLDLPEKTYIDEYVDMLPQQAVIYKEVKAFIKQNIDKISTAPNPLAELIRMRQATGYTGILSTEIKCSAKLDRMQELVEDSIENGRKVVIFSNWTKMTDEIYNRLEQYEPGVITGETSEEERESLVHDFQNNEHMKVMIGTIGALGTGLTLTEGSVVIFLDEPWSTALKEQAIDRCHRIGQKNRLTIYTIMCKDTIDERIHSLVIEKGQMSDAIVDGRITGSKREILDYLLD